MNQKKLLVFSIGFFLFFLPGIAFATPIFYGPSAYLSDADIPVGFYSSGSPTALENFEDSSLDFGISASAGYVIPPSYPTLIDSVDEDDGTIDGSGSDGHSWFFSPGSTGVTFTFSSPVTAAGLVWTDGAGTTTFEAFGVGMSSLGMIGPFSIADAFHTGETAEDRFFGITDLDGIYAIKISNTSGGIEVDHVQYGSAASQPVPEPATMLLFGLGLLGLAGVNRRKE